MSQAAASAARSLPPVISEYLAASDRGDDEAERCRQRAFPVLEPDLLGHARHPLHVTAIFEAIHCYFSSYTRD